MKYLKSLHEASKLSIKSMSDMFTASIRMEKQLKAVRKLTKEYDWKNKTPEEFLIALQESIKMQGLLKIDFDNLTERDQTKDKIIDLKLERCLIEYAIKHKKGWIGNAALNVRIREIGKEIENLEKVIVKMFIPSKCTSFIYIRNEDNSIFDELPITQGIKDFMRDKQMKYVRGTIDEDGKFHIEVEVIGKDF